MDKRITVGLFFLTVGLLGVIVSLAYAFSGGNPFETEPFSRRNPGYLTFTSLGGVALGVALLLDIGSVADIILD
ncbi:hypothetical protein RBH26_04335 [Natronolimnohabitans sp. A-GB9]|uniref:hypothetical protein n=1 Tax=Natronolimnohabitans sp. A-GB9 TaxID=3069757 RepID=UPI0027B46950|nr:hypothetical protein [Natronolimnohabitans sp. A-GB9]MDQ2049706.1 hypothetical protein [Natronolimnohabitans sp. A-GB9]